MTDVAELIADMVRQGVDADLIGRTAAALAEREPVRLVDEQAERRRERDRDRKRLRKSAESAEENASTKEIPPIPPKENNPPLKENPPKGGQKKRASRLREDWVLPDEWREDALTAGLPEHLIDRESQTMRDWSLSSPTGAKRDWRAAWRNWVKRAVDKLPRGSPNKPETNSDKARRLLRENRNADQGAVDFGSYDASVRHISAPSGVA